MDQDTTLVIATVGAITGMVGTIVGIVALLRQIDRDRVRLRIGARWAITSDSPGTRLISISVTNLSTFPVTLSEVGVLCDNGRQRVIDPHALAQLPKRIEARTAVSILLSPQFLRNAMCRTATYAFARTDCGEWFQSRGDCISKIVSEAQSERVERSPLA